MTGSIRFGPCSGYKVVLFADFADPHIKYPSYGSILLLTNDMAESPRTLNINTVHNVYVVEEVIQLTIKLNAEIIANSHCSKDLT